MSGIYGFVFGKSYDFEPTSVLRTQKHLILKQLLASYTTIKLKSVQDQLKLEKSKEQSWITLIKQRKINRKKALIREK